MQAGGAVWGGELPEMRAHRAVETQDGVREGLAVDMPRWGQRNIHVSDMGFGWRSTRRMECSSMAEAGK